MSNPSTWTYFCYITQQNEISFSFPFLTMKLLSFALPILLSSFEGVKSSIHQPSNTIHYHSQHMLGPAIWHFNADGLVLFSPDGTELMHPPHNTAHICPPWDRTRSGVTTMVNTCIFYDIMSDGHRYIWTAGATDDSRVKLFDLDTGHYVGYWPSCHQPIDFDYHPGHREMYAICYDNSVAVYSVDAVGVEDWARIDTFAGGAGHIVMHDTLGSVGYVVSPYDPLSLVDLSSRTLFNGGTFFEHPGAFGFDFATYSPVNQHLYLRVTVSCACGFAEADSSRDCPSWGPQEGDRPIKHGIYAGRTDVGVTCTRRCYGTPADAVGVVEFDTASKKFVGNPIKLNSGFGAQAYASPDGEYLFVVANDGGQVVRLLQPGKNGQPSVRKRYPAKTRQKVVDSHSYSSRHSHTASFSLLFPDLFEGPSCKLGPSR